MSQNDYDNKIVKLYVCLLQYLLTIETSYLHKNETTRHEDTIYTQGLGLPLLCCGNTTHA